jgi:hypothetical protein
MRKNVFLVLCLLFLVFGFLFQGCDLPDPALPYNEPDCEVSGYNAVLIYERIKKPIFYDPNDNHPDVWAVLSWEEGHAVYFEKVDDNKYRAFLEVPVSKNGKDHALWVMDKRLWIGREDPVQYSCNVVENIYIRIPGKTGNIKLTKNQPCSLITNDTGFREVLFKLHCDGHININ